MSRTRSLMEEEIIRVAIQCFSERGYQNTTLDDIVSQVNISRVTFYTYFKSKEALLKTIFERVNTTYQQGLEEIFAQPLSCREKLRQAALFQIMSVTNKLPLARIFFREEANVPSDTFFVTDGVPPQPGPYVAWPLRMFTMPNCMNMADPAFGCDLYYGNQWFYATANSFASDWNYVLSYRVLHDLPY